MKLQKSNILINKKKSSLIPKHSIEFLGADWAKDGITRVTKVDYQIIEIINFISRRKRSYSLKKAQQIAGYLNYYLAIAGPTVYKIVTFYLHNFNSFNSHKAWWSLMVRKLLTINNMKFNKAARLEQCTIINQLHVDASLTHAALYHIEEDYHEVVPIHYQAPVYVAELQAAYIGLKYIILKAKFQFNVAKIFE